MIDKIKNDPVLTQFIKEFCCENGICATIDDIDNSFVILDPDEFYKSLKLGNTPASVDCIIVQKCENYGYNLILVELKNTNNFNSENLIAKFETSLQDFISNRFKSVLNVNYNKVKLYFVSTLRIDNLTFEYFTNLKKFYFQEKKLIIQPVMRNLTIDK